MWQGHEAHDLFHDPQIQKAREKYRYGLLVFTTEERK
jgi:hypothetical protein